MSFTIIKAALLMLPLSSLITASPISDIFHNLRPAHRGKGISVSQVSNPNYNGTAGGWGPTAYEYAMAKYGGSINSTATDAISASKKAAVGTVAASPAYAYYDKEYLCQVKIGTPAQTVPLDFDTGSADLWVFSSQTPASSVSSGKAIYKPSKSSTAKLVSGATWAITYGDGSSSSGDVYTDLVNVGGLSVKAQTVESAKQVSSQFSSDTVLSGLLGLSFSTSNQVKPNAAKTFFDNIKASLPLPIFTANLKKGAAGSYNFGYIDTKQYTGSISYATVTSRYSLWEFSTSGYSIGTGTRNTAAMDAIADTGTSLLLLPSSVVTAYYARLPGSYYASNYGAYIYPCATTPPSFSFYISNAKQTVPGSYINYGAVSSTMCYGGIQSQGSLPFSIFGDIALKAQFVVFDASVPRIGWANKGAS